MTPPVWRKRGKLSKKEVKEMRNKHKDISRLLTPLPPKEDTSQVKTIAGEMEEMEMERIDEEREQRLERLRRRKLEWIARRADKTVIKASKEAVNIKMGAR